MSAALDVVLALWVLGSAGFLIVRKERYLRKLERGIRQLRATLDSEVDYRTPGADDRDLAALADRFAPEARVLCELGFTALGTQIAQVQAGMRYLVAWWIDVDGRSVVELHVVGAPDRPTSSASIESFSAADHYITTLYPALLGPPFIHRQQLRNATLPQLVVRHREIVEHVADLVRIATLDDMVRETKRAWSAAIAWRRAQPADQLLEQDLRGLLGARYAEIGPRMISWLGARLPKATIVRS